jgi:hypothetical protein
MRTTIQLDDDVAAAVDQLRRESRLGVSEAVNELVRRGLAAPRKRPKFSQRTAPLGLRIPIDDIGEALELIEDTQTR